MVQLPYQAVMEPNRMLSIVHLKRFVRVLGDKANFFSLEVEVAPSSPHWWTTLVCQ
jgi:hypothetical protein